MEIRQLGSTGLSLSVRGLGTWAFGGAGWAGTWGPQPVEDCAGALATAVDKGVNWIDTAPAYGLGRAEEVLGELVGRTGVDVLIATKCGERIGQGATYRSGDPAGIAADCEASLHRLRRDVIDLYQLHHTPPDVPIEVAWQAMQKLVEDGKVRHIGLCNSTVADLDRCQKIFPVASYQGPYSPLRRAMEDAILPYCRENGIGVLPFGALGLGFLSGRRNRSDLAPDDWRRAERWTAEFERGQRLVSALTAIAPENVYVGNLTAGWLIDQPGVVATPIGARTREQAAKTFGDPDLSAVMPAVSRTVDKHRLVVAD
jgi:aryl-alcohol dehydrogenase-like predicted oxidoreductase